MLVGTCTTTFIGFSCVRNVNILSHKAAKRVEDAIRAVFRQPCGCLTRVILHALAYANPYDGDPICTILTTGNRFIAVCYKGSRYGDW
jgi:hypothetical protein